jgi:hypothetical protein
MGTGAAMIDPDACIASLRKLLDACDFHLFAAPTHRTFGTTGL